MRLGNQYLLGPVVEVLSMSRQTAKVKNTEDYIKLATRDKQEFINKLGKLEDLEEELGCPLEVMVKAIKNGIYYDDKFEYPVFILDKDNFKDKNYHLLVVGTIVYLKEYKETFWLKEDKSE